MKDYTFSVVVQEDEEFFERVEDVPNAVGAGQSGELFDITFVVEAQDAVKALFEACSQLQDAGLTPLRIYTDLVSLSDIAERTGVSRQTVRNWSNATRRGGFPPHHATAGVSRLWHWSDVYEWLMKSALEPVGAYATTPADLESIDIYNGQLARTRRKAHAGWVKPVNEPQLEVVAANPSSETSPVDWQEGARGVLKDPWKTAVKADF